jgi:hypothetical protein
VWVPAKRSALGHELTSRRRSAMSALAAHSLWRAPFLYELSRSGVVLSDGRGTQWKLG